jgi:hypothetical protein
MKFVPGVGVSGLLETGGAAASPDIGAGGFQFMNPFGSLIASGLPLLSVCDAVGGGAGDAPPPGFGVVGAAPRAAM